MKTMQASTGGLRTLMGGVYSECRDSESRSLRKTPRREDAKTPFPKTSWILGNGPATNYARVPVPWFAGYLQRKKEILGVFASWRFFFSPLGVLRLQPAAAAE